MRDQRQTLPNHPRHPQHLEESSEVMLEGEESRAEGAEKMAVEMGMMVNTKDKPMYKRETMWSTNLLHTFAHWCM